MATTEHTINDAIAEVLRGTRRAWRDSDIVSSENTGQIKGSTARPDILVLEPNVSPVVIETEVLPAVTVEAEAVARLGVKLKKTGHTILSSLAVRLPLRLRGKSGKALQNDLLNSADLEICLYTGSGPQKQTRWPKSGWIIGTIGDLSILTQSATGLGRHSAQGEKARTREGSCGEGRIGVGHGLALPFQPEFSLQQPIHEHAVHDTPNHRWTSMAINQTRFRRTGKSARVMEQYFAGDSASLVAQQ